MAEGAAREHREARRKGGDREHRAHDEQPLFSHRTLARPLTASPTRGEAERPFRGNKKGEPEFYVGPNRVVARAIETTPARSTGLISCDQRKPEKTRPSAAVARS